MDKIAVKEVMSRNPAIVKEDMTIKEAANLFKNRGISTLIVEEHGDYVGIVTDRDLVTKILAEGNDPESTTVGEIMSHPVIMISSEESISTAARVMSGRRIRKLPVISNGKIVGILSENDIVRIAPDLVVLAKEYSTIKMNGDIHHGHHESKEYIAGRCEACGQYSLRLRYGHGMLLCPECYESMES